MILERGTLLNNRYRIVEILGQGGMGSVYRAVDENLGVEVAVKDNLFTTDEYARQFRREAIILANLRHPNLPRVTDHFILNGQGQYLVMDYIEGEDLRQRMERVGLIPDEEVILIGAAVCDALAFLGTRKPAIIHRDLKPGNVKITPQGHIFLVDFGLAKTLQGSQATTTGARAMTPGYSPPEQYGTARTDQRSDIFSLGATLYAALTGTTPEDALARAMDQAELTPIRKPNPKVSKRLANVIEKALEVRPDDRYQTADEFKQALLSAGSNSIRRRDGDFSVSPPPWEADGETPGLSAEALAADHQNGKGAKREPAEKVAPVAIKSPPLLAISTPLPEEEPEPRPRKTRTRKNERRRSCLLYLLLAVAVLGLSSALVYRLDPNLPGRAYGRYWPTLSAVMPDGVKIAGAAVSPATATPASGQGSHSPTYTAPVVILPSLTPTLTPTITPTDTPVPTPTFTLVPTPQGGAQQIAFASNLSGIPQIFVIDADGAERRQVTNLAEGACQPDWGPDGKRLVFISPCSNNTDYYPNSSMYIVNEDGKGLLPLPTLSGGDYDPRFSPDGNFILFTSLRNSGRPQLYVLNLSDYSVRAVSGKFSTDFQASWSPNGKKLVYISTVSDLQQVWTMDVSGKNARPFTPNKSYLNARPFFSPDGKSILYTQYVAEGSIPRANISPFILEPDDFVEHRIGDLPMREATYSPDGYWLAFEGWQMGGSHDIYLISATGAGLTSVTNDTILDFDPDWRPLVPLIPSPNSPN